MDPPLIFFTISKRTICIRCVCVWGGLLVLWLIVHNDSKNWLKRFLFNEKIALLNELLFIRFFFPFGAWNLDILVNIDN